MDNIIFDKLHAIVRDVFDNQSIMIVNDTISDDIEEWDSLTHIQLLDTLEKEFSINFDLDEMLNLKTMGDIINSIEEKII